MPAAPRPDGVGPQGPRRDALALLLAAFERGEAPPRAELRAVIGAELRRLAARYPGHAVEVRVPPLAAVQCLPGPRHTRGTPPNVVELEPLVFLRLAAGRWSWAQVVAAGAVRASGERADLSGVLPLP